jgi:prepilin-type processing-associated H-X9-DG protein
VVSRLLFWLRYLGSSQCDDRLGEDRCVRRLGHKTWHTKNGNLCWGDGHE